MFCHRREFGKVLRIHEGCGGTRQLHYMYAVSSSLDMSEQSGSYFEDYDTCEILEKRAVSLTARDIAYARHGSRIMADSQTVANGDRGTPELSHHSLI